LVERYGDLVVFFVLTLLAEIIGTIGGFGSSLFFVSIFQFIYDFQLVLALTGLLHVFSNTAKVFLFWKAIDWKLTLWIGSSSLLLAVGGAYLTRYVELEYARLVLGCFLLVFSVFFFVNPDFSAKPVLKTSLLGGGVAGFLAGFIGTGGAIRGLVLASFNLERNLFVGTSAAIDFGVDLSRTWIYIDAGYFGNAPLVYIPLLFVASLLGSYLGKLALARISQELFRKVLLGLIFLVGVSLILETLI